MKKSTLILAACLVALPLSAGAAEDRTHDRKQPVTKAETITTKTTVEAIDHTNRTVTLKDRDGNMVTLYATPGLTGFDDLKVGDKVTFRYTEAVALEILEEGDPGYGDARNEAESTPGVPDEKPGSPGGGAGSGAASPSGSTSGTAAGPAGTGALMGEQVTTMVTVKDKSEKNDSLTFETQDGHLMTVHVDDKDLLKDVQPGDQIQITYSNALLVSVDKR